MACSAVKREIDNFTQGQVRYNPPLYLPLILGLGKLPFTYMAWCLETMTLEITPKDES